VSTTEITPFGVELASDLPVDSARLRSSDGWVAWLKIVQAHPHLSLTDQLHRLNRGFVPDFEPPLDDLMTGREELLMRLIGLARTRGFYVAIDELDCGRDGEWHPIGGAIRLSESLEPGRMAAVLIHELAHALDPGTRSFDGPDPSERELVAESAAFVAGRRLGLDMHEVSAYFTVTFGLTAERAVILARDVLDVAERLTSLVAQLEGDA